MSSPSEPTFLDFAPVPLAFGTSGLRGLVKDITDLEAYINTRGFLEFALKSGDALPGGRVILAGDLRPSTERILRAVARAVWDTGLSPEYAGRIPTPALTYCAMQRGLPSVMVTGSHIPFDRNGIKFNKSAGEVLKSEEASILSEVAKVREMEYGRAATETIFDSEGMLKGGARCELPEEDPSNLEMYVRRYLDVFSTAGLKGRRLLVYQHSAVGRDLLVRLLEALGADVIAAGRSEEFIPIDTENVTDEQLDRLDAMAKEASALGPLDALVSTDGDSDRPLVVGVVPASEADKSGRIIRFYGGDLLGILVAEHLQSDAAAVPISANDAVDIHLGRLGTRLVKTKIGSPYVIAAMKELEASGQFRRITSWEANGGFLTGTDLALGGRTLRALPTRDAFLPILAALFSAFDRGLAVAENFARLPKRYSRAGLLDDFPPETSRAILARFSPSDPSIQEVDFAAEGILSRDRWGAEREAGSGQPLASEMAEKRREIESFFTPAEGFGPVEKIVTIDGVRVWFSGGDIAHVRPSGNAPQLRVYACSDSQERADAIAELCLREPAGILRRIEKAIG